MSTGIKMHPRLERRGFTDKANAALELTKSPANELMDSLENLKNVANGQSNVDAKRYAALAITALEESYMWATRACSRITE